MINIDFNVHRMIILQGISGSGKSTYAGELRKKNERVVIVSRDEIRKQLLGEQVLEKYFRDGLNLEIEKEVTKIEYMAIVRALMSEQTVVIDNTNLRRKYVTSYCKLAIDCGLTPSNVVLIPVGDPLLSVDEAFARIQKRGKRIISKEVLRKQYDQRRKALSWDISYCWKYLSDHNYSKKNWFSPPFPVKPYTPIESAQKAVICDIDGTLAHRKLLLDPPSYRSYYDYSASDSDTIDTFVKTILEGLVAKNIKIIFFTGRGLSGVKATTNFIEKNLGKDFPYEIYFRNEHTDVDNDLNNLPDDVVKYNLFNDMVRDEYNVIGVFDDRKKVVSLWEALGLRVANMGLLNEVF